MIAGLLEILRFPVQLTYARHTVIDHHGLFVSDIEGRLGVEDLEAGGPEDAARSVVLDFTTVASRVEHHSNLDGATPNPPVQSPLLSHRAGHTRYFHEPSHERE